MMVLGGGGVLMSEVPLYHIKSDNVLLSTDGPHPHFFIDNVMVRIHFIIEMIWWTGLAPWQFEFPFPGSLISAFPETKGARPL